MLFRRLLIGERTNGMARRGGAANMSALADAWELFDSGRETRARVAASGGVSSMPGFSVPVSWFVPPVLPAIPCCQHRQLPARLRPDL